MKNKKTLILLTSILISNSTIAEKVCKKNFGIIECGYGTVSSISFTGMAEINGTNVTDFFDILGNVQITNAIINNMHVKGMNEISDTKISGKMQVTGEVKANKLNILAPVDIVGNWFGKDIKFNSSVKMIGTVDCNRCTFDGASGFVGSVKFTKSKFNKNITIKSNISEFSDTISQDINIEKPSNSSEPKIILSKNSMAKNIVFHDCFGTVVLMSNSKVTGKVERGKIVYK